MLKHKVMRSPYSHRHWLILRRQILATHPLCVICLEARPRRVRKADHVDHINGFNSRREFFDTNNLQPLCVSCHSKKTHTSGGPDYLRRSKERLSRIQTFDF